MRAQLSATRLLSLLLGAAVLAVSGWTLADPPTRVARVGYLTGNVSLSPSGERDWVQARLNRALTSGDRLWTDRGARVELQIGGAVIRMDENTSLTLLNLDDNIAQIQLDQGTLNLRVRQLGPQQSLEVATPNLAFVTRQAGSYRVAVEPMDDATTIVVRSGRGEVYGEQASYAVDTRQAYRFAGSGLRSYEFIATPRADAFERWAGDRDRLAESSASARYVSSDLIGYEDLDANGTWRNEPGYGNVWTPSRVSADWTPYRDGHWTWIDPWGWTWVDDAPWGFAVSHYGRWANLRGRWAWVPGPARSRAVYAPALVAFVGGDNFQISLSSGSVGGVAWFPLGPREVYRPSYPVSRGYFDNVNRSNTTINNTTITNVYNNRNVSNLYVNRQVQGAVVAVAATAFVQSQPVSRAAVRLSREAAARAPVSAVAAVAPVRQSVRGGAAAAGTPPADARPRAGERRVVVRNAPPAARPGFAAQERELAAKPGTPLAPPARAALKPATPALAPNVVVAAPPQAAPPKALPPANAPDGKPGARESRDGRSAEDERRRERDRGAKGEQRGKGELSEKPPAVPLAPPPAVPAPVKPAPAPAQASPVPPAPPLQPQRDDKGPQRERQRDVERGAKGDQPAKPPAPLVPPTAPIPAAPSGAVKPVPVPTQAAPAPTPGQREREKDTRGERQRDRAPEAKGAPTAPPPAPPPVPQAAPTPTAPAVQPNPAPVPPPAPPVQAAPPAVPAQPQRDEKGARGERQRERESGAGRNEAGKGERTGPVPTPAAPVKPAPAPAPVTPPPPPVTPKPEPAPVPVKPAPPPVQPPPPPVKPAAPPPPPAPPPVAVPPPVPVPPKAAPAAVQAPVAPPVIAPPPAAPPKPRPDADKRGDKSDRQRDDAAAKKGDDDARREKGEKK